jgi:hypothetical protein
MALQTVLDLARLLDDERVARARKREAAAVAARYNGAWR